MEQLLLKQDKQAIERDIELAENAAVVFDKIYSTLRDHGFNPNYKIVEDTVVSTANRADIAFGNVSSDIVKNFLKTLIAERKNTSSEALGFDVNKEKLKDLIEVSTDQILDFVDVLNLIDDTTYKYSKLIDLNTKTDKVELESDAKEKIVQWHTDYAVGERQIQVAKSLFALKEAFEAYKKTLKISALDAIVDGLIFTNGGQINIDVSYVKRQ